MAVTRTQVATNSSTATLLVTADVDGCRLTVHHQGAGTVYLGGSNVTASNGMGLDTGAGPTAITLGANDKLYGIASAGTPSIQILIIGNAS